MIGKRASCLNQGAEIIGRSLDQFLVADQVERPAPYRPLITEFGAFFSSGTVLLHHQTPCPLHQLWIGTNQICLGDGDVDRRLSRCVVFGVDNSGGLFFVAGLEAVPLSRFGIEAVIDFSPFAEPIFLTHRHRSA